MMPNVTLIKGGPGVGKTTAVGERCAELAHGGAQAVVALERVELVHEFVSLLPAGSAAPILGKTNDGPSGPLCVEPERITTARQQGLAAYESELACGQCPAFSSCRYYAQFQSPALIWAGTTQMLGLPPVKEKIEASTQLFLDEGARSAFLPDPVAVTANELHRALKVGIAVSPMLAAMGGGRRGYRRRVRDGLHRYEVGRFLRSAGAYNKQAFAEGSPPLAPGVLALLRALYDERGPNSRIHVVDGRMLVRQPLELPAVPTMVLDGTGDAAFYEMALGRPVTAFVDPVVSRHATVVQCTRARFGKRHLGDLGVRKELAVLAQAIIDRRGTPGGRVAVVTFKGFAAELGNTLKGEFRTYHFWGLRGTNRVLEDGCTDILVLGTPTPPPDEIVAAAEALAWRSKREIVDEQVRTVAAFGSVPDKAVPVWRYVDHRPQSILTMDREGELLQVAERTRSLVPPNQLVGKYPLNPERLADRQIWLVTSLPVPGLRPDLLVPDLDGLLGSIE